MVDHILPISEVRREHRLSQTGHTRGKMHPIARRPLWDLLVGSRASWSPAGRTHGAAKKRSDLTIDTSAGQMGSYPHSLIGELERELATRNKVYPRWIREGKITEGTANHRRHCISETIRILDEL